MIADQKVCGIDYGSKLAGTTVVAYADQEALIWRSSQKGEDADDFVMRTIDELCPTLVVIDAPLSLPGVYTGIAGCDNYFYRQCDRDTKAMSPMFLGGLTARAMKLSSQMREQGITVIEGYPVKTGGILELKDFGYRTKNADLMAILQKLLVHMELTFDGSGPVTGHHIDALLALHIGRKYVRGEATEKGLPEEGLIYM